MRRQYITPGYTQFMPTFVSRAGLKLDHALTQFNIDVTGFTCADFGCNTGGFVDCLLSRNATKVFAIDTGYGVLDWKLRNDPRVIVMERTNAMHVKLPEKMDLISIDVAWTRQKTILPSAIANLKPNGMIVTLIKPHYQAALSQLRKGILLPELIENVLQETAVEIQASGLQIISQTQSPITGAKGNVEFLAHLKLRTQDFSHENSS